MVAFLPLGYALAALGDGELASQLRRAYGALRQGRTEVPGHRTRVCAGVRRGPRANMAMVMQFFTYFWDGAVVEPSDRDAVEALAGHDLPVAERRAALHRLLASPSVVARGIGMDYASRRRADMRHGDVPLIDETVSYAVRQVALRELAAPPVERVELGDRSWSGANHASALFALWSGADPSDATLVARVLGATDEPRVLEPGVGAAEPILRGHRHRELVEVLERIVNRRSVTSSTRASALFAIAACADESVAPFLIASLSDPELAISAAAARCLLESDLERHRMLVEHAAAAWQLPEFPPYDVSEVYRLLDRE